MEMLVALEKLTWVAEPDLWDDVEVGPAIDDMETASYISMLLEDSVPGYEHRPRVSPALDNVAASYAVEVDYLGFDISEPLA